MGSTSESMVSLHCNTIQGYLMLRNF